MTIIIILFLLVILMTTKDQNCIAGKLRNSSKYNKPPLSRKGFPSTRCESCKLAVMASRSLRLMLQMSHSDWEGKHRP